MSELVPSQTSSTAIQQQQQQASQVSSFSSSSSSSFSATSSSSTSSSTKVVKQSMTSIKQSSSSTMSSSSSSSKMVSIKSSGTSYSDRLALDLGISDISKEMDRLQLRLGDEMANIHRDMFQLMPGSPEVQSSSSLTSSTTTSAIEAGSSSSAVGGGPGGLNQFLVKMDNDAIRSCIDKAHDDRVKLNFDVNEFDSETINIRTVGNKIEVHAMKKSKKGDEERSEEFSRVYELPNELDPSHVTSSIYQDGVLTIELPVSDALGAVAQ